MRSEMFTRRTATVTMSAPEASCACTITAGDEYFPGADDEPRREGLAGDDEVSICHLVLGGLCVRRAIRRLRS